MYVTDFECEADRLAYLSDPDNAIKPLDTPSWLKKVDHSEAGVKILLSYVLGYINIKGCTQSLSHVVHTTSHIHRCHLERGREHVEDNCN